jgi:hypothetical protein
VARRRRSPLRDLGVSLLLIGIVYVVMTAMFQAGVPEKIGQSLASGMNFHAGPTPSASQ